MSTATVPTKSVTADRFGAQHVVVIGSGLAGLTTALRPPPRTPPHTPPPPQLKCLLQELCGDDLCGCTGSNDLAVFHNHEIIGVAHRQVEIV